MKLDDAMVKSLIQNRTEFVKLFLDNATDMEQFLDVNNLWNIYANVRNLYSFYTHFHTVNIRKGLRSVTYLNMKNFSVIL